MFSYSPWQKRKEIDSTYNCAQTTVTECNDQVNALLPQPAGFHIPLGS